MQATVDTTQTTLESPINLSVTIAGDDGEVDTSTIRDFKVLSKASSSSIQIINGRVNRERTLTYTLLPLREGTLTIPALSVTIDGKKSFTDSITVEVSKSETTAGASTDVSVTGTVSESRPYLGQQFVYTFKLLYGVQIANTNYEPPTFDGFSATQIGKQTTGQRLINGRQFQEVAISYLLVPLKTGSLVIGPATLQCDMVSSRRSSRSMFDPFFNDPFFNDSQQLTPKVLGTNEVSIEVLPLPEWKGPEVFSGLVGQFDMKAELEAPDTTVGKSTTLSVILKGKGNLQDAEKPKFQIPDAFKQYADQPEVDVKLGPDGYAGKKVFKTALVPIKDGIYKLEVTPMVYFDPNRKTYRRMAASALSITVHKSATPIETPMVFSAQNPEGTTSPLQKEKVDFTGHDILSIKTGLDALSNQTLIPTAWFLGILAAPGIVFLAVFGLLGIVKKDTSPGAVMTRRAQTALNTAIHATGSDSADLLSNLYRALLYAVFAKAGTLGESLTRGELEALLNRAGADPEMSAGVSALFGRLESALFGKSALSREEQKALVAETGRRVKGLVQ